MVNTPNGANNPLSLSSHGPWQHLNSSEETFPASTLNQSFQRAGLVVVFVICTLLGDFDETQTEEIRSRRISVFDKWR